MNMFVCLFVCLSASMFQESHVQISPIFARIARGRGSVLWQHCNMLCTSGFVGDVEFSYNGSTCFSGNNESTTLRNTFAPEFRKSVKN